MCCLANHAVNVKLSPVAKLIGLPDELLIRLFIGGTQAEVGDVDQLFTGREPVIVSCPPPCAKTKVSFWPIR